MENNLAYTGESLLLAGLNFFYLFFVNSIFEHTGQLKESTLPQASHEAIDYATGVHILFEVVSHLIYQCLDSKTP